MLISRRLRGAGQLVVSPESQAGMIFARRHVNFVSVATDKGMNSHIVRDEERAWIGQRAKELAITGAFENFDKVVQALQILERNSGQDARDVLKSERAIINKLCARSRRGVGSRSS
jgi:hypothetical protein